MERWTLFFQGVGRRAQSRVALRIEISELVAPRDFTNIR